MDATPQGSPKDDPTTEGPALAVAYRNETTRVVRQRLALVAITFVVLMGAGVAFEVLTYPERTPAVVTTWVVESAIMILAAIASRYVTRPGLVGAVAMGCVSLLVARYHAAVAQDAERMAMTLTTFLNGLAVLAPWGPWMQALGAGLTLVATTVATPVFTSASSEWVLALIAIGAAAVTSIAGAFFLDRYRAEAFRRASLHAEEAEIAATLLKVTEILSARLGADDMLEQVNRLSVEALRCDWSSCFLYDGSRNVYRLASNFGSSPAVRDALRQLEFAPESMPLLSGLRPGTLVEIERADGQDLAPAAILRRAENASAIYAPISRGDTIVGVLVSGYRTREGAFSPRQRRFALGIAHATTVALENARLVETLRAASRLKSDFVATMSHELRTPLNVIMGYTEMLAEDVYTPGTAEYRETLGRVQRASVELMDLITATLDMGRLETGRETVMLGPVHVGRVLEEIAREVEPLVPPGVRFQYDDALGAESVTTDGAKLKTVVKNLVGNALKFTTDGTVEVSARTNGDFLLVAVRDTGIGIAPEHLPVIFEMFRQLDGSTTRRYGGVGLGLHIVKHLVTLLGGTIEVESAVGAGSTFMVTIPVPRATRQRATGT